ncbi:MAG: rluB [Deltaproteobacteria bacterium]|jgi:pseudouridine synthase|nr:rluB [Deltaproteobacteria bacterium]
MERIQKILAKAGIASRREAEKMILEGRVMVNGAVIDTLGFKADPLKDHIKVDGKRLPHYEPKITLLLNKPRGYLCTVKDPEERRTIMDLLTKVKGRIYPVGRLDFDAEGLVILTNDGDLAHRLSHPKFSIPRTYLAKISGVPDEKKLNRLKKGIVLEDGRAKAVFLLLLHPGEKNSWVRVVVAEGRNHLVKRMFAAIGHSVLKLKRVAFGPLQLGTLPPGQFRYLTPEEIEKLKTFEPKAMRSVFGGRRSEGTDRNKARNIGPGTPRGRRRTPDGER